MKAISAVARKFHRVKACGLIENHYEGDENGQSN